MFKAMLTGIGLFAGTLLYTLVISGGLDWVRACFVGAAGFIAHAIYHVVASRRPGIRHD